mmetsp:Transcript_19145/g.49432  ORF Transcript_19145/g.49432 Transcript_19145/m.49432 type:complete len:265 (-) Transcript_19145:294-1088(-)|eukprot:CAMPEP_0119420020 /NCGR_PEP_ID=MMETSP1335-20130426/22415_1 /TAXON_ID=259385 /ORGANISM="Chrysoculter rhomboideus, Strain RCC1486" /LENGTH=264 /DNA_ID=CAMNT_0007445355 /DNA_START=39 /DNA_END=833 /DNA_ORIENTATION=+
MSARQYALATAAAIGAGVIYVLVHERRRKMKKELQRKMEQPIPKEQLVEILLEASAEAAKFAEQIGVWVAKMQKEHNLSEERAHQVRQQKFEATLDEVINKIRQKKGVGEKMMDLAFRQHMEDKDVQAALTSIRRQIAPQLASGARGSSAPASGSSSSSPVRVPASLTKNKLKEVMVYNAVQLEKELAPIRAQVAEAKKSNPKAQMNPQVLVELQTRISDAVKARFGYSDQQVMGAVDKYQAKEDPEFREVLTRITNTLNSALE